MLRVFYCLAQEILSISRIICRRTPGTSTGDNGQQIMVADFSEAAVAGERKKSEFSRFNLWYDTFLLLLPCIAVEVTHFTAEAFYLSRGVGSRSGRESHVVVKFKRFGDRHELFRTIASTRFMNGDGAQ